MREIDIKISVNALANSPEPSQHWILLSEKERLALISKELDSSSWRDVEILRARNNGYVTVALVKALTPAERGQFLLDLEELLKREIDTGLTVWLEPQADKSVLRKLRGVEVK